MSRSPSKRVLWTLAVTVAVVGGTIATSAIIDARTRRAEANPSNPSLPIGITRDPNLATLEDSDGDMLFDWEESLRGTNPKVADTDGDGTQDGAEVAAARDPRVRGPNDSAVAVASSTDAALSDDYQKNRRAGTLTDRFAEDFASRYVELKSDGGFTADDQAALLGTLDGLSGGGAVAVTYSADLIPRLADLSPDSLKRYSDAIAQAHVDGIVPIARSMGAGAGANVFGVGFREMARDLASIPTPEGLARAQAQLANAYETTGSVVLTLAAEDDPLASLVSIPSLQKAEDARVSAAQEIAGYLAAQGVALQSGTYGNFWTKMVESQ